MAESVHRRARRARVQPRRRRVEREPIQRPDDPGGGEDAERAQRVRARRRHDRRAAHQEGKRARDAREESRVGDALVHLPGDLRPGADDQAPERVRRAVQREENRAEARRPDVRAVRPREDHAVHQVARRDRPGGGGEGGAFYTLDFARRISPSTPRFQSPPSTPFNFN
eukprot:31382-Pelagococcus_subviridis.AAC.4